MPTCANHPGRETSYLCLKHNIALCEECLACSDPQLFCKFRPACIIWFMTKKVDGIDAGSKKVRT